MATLVDSRSVTVATVVQPSVSGQITEVLYWNPKTSQFQNTAPTDVSLGGYVGVRVAYRNTGQIDQTMWVYFDFKRPNGTSAMSMWSTPVLLSPNSASFAEAKYISDAIGQWTCDIRLYAEY